MANFDDPCDMGCMIRRIDKTINCPVPRLVPRSSSQFSVPSYHMDQNCHMQPGLDLHGRSAAHSPVGSRRGNSNAVQTPRRNGCSYSVYQSVCRFSPLLGPNATWAFTSRLLCPAKYGGQPWAAVEVTGDHRGRGRGTASAGVLRRHGSRAGAVMGCDRGLVRSELSPQFGNVPYGGPSGLSGMAWHDFTGLQIAVDLPRLAGLLKMPPSSGDFCQTAVH